MVTTIFIIVCVCLLILSSFVDISKDVYVYLISTYVIWAGSSVEKARKELKALQTDYDEKFESLKRDQMDLWKAKKRK